MPPICVACFVVSSNGTILSNTITFVNQQKKITKSCQTHLGLHFFKYFLSMIKPQALWFFSQTQIHKIINYEMDSYYLLFAPQARVVYCRCLHFLFLFCLSFTYFLSSIFSKTCVDTNCFLVVPLTTNFLVCYTILFSFHLTHYSTPSHYSYEKFMFLTIFSISRLYEKNNGTKKP
jgi:hypothetical protein